MAVEARIEGRKRQAERDRLLAFNTAALTGAAFSGNLKPFAECFPGRDDKEPVSVSRLSPESAKMLGALFKLKGRGVAMQVEKISLH